MIPQSSTLTITPQGQPPPHLQLFALGYAVGIQVGQVYLQEAQDHLHSLHLL